MEDVTGVPTNSIVFQIVYDRCGQLLLLVSMMTFTGSFVQLDKGRDEYLEKLSWIYYGHPSLNHHNHVRVGENGTRNRKHFQISFDFRQTFKIYFSPLVLTSAIL